MKDELTTVQGIIVPARWDKKGDVVAVAVATMDEQEFMVEVDAVGRNLLSHIHQEAVLRGSVKRKQKKSILKVETFKIMGFKIGERAKP